MPISPFWAILFFLTLLTLGIDSQFGMVDTLLSGIFDFWPQLRKKKVLVTGVVCSICFLIGLPLTAEGGMYLYILLDWYTAAITVTTVAFIEIVVVAYIYGLRRFSNDVKLMLGSQPSWYYKATWLVATPIYMGIIVFVGLWNLSAPTYRDYEYPQWTIAIGWIISATVFSPIPIFAIYAIYTSKQESILLKLKSVFIATDEWVPAKNSLIEEYKRQYYGNSDKRLTDSPPKGQTNQSYTPDAEVTYL